MCILEWPPNGRCKLSVPGVAPVFQEILALELPSSFSRITFYLGSLCQTLFTFHCVDQSSVNGKMLYVRYSRRTSFNEETMNYVTKGYPLAHFPISHPSVTTQISTRTCHPEIDRQQRVKVLLLRQGIRGTWCNYRRRSLCGAQTPSICQRSNLVNESHALARNKRA